MRHYTAVRGDWEDGDVEGTLEALAGAMRATGVDIDAPDSQGCSALHCGLDPSVRASYLWDPEDGKYSSDKAAQILVPFNGLVVASKDESFSRAEETNHHGVPHLTVTRKTCFHACWSQACLATIKSLAVSSRQSAVAYVIAM